MSESPPSSANGSSESASPEAAPPPNGRGDGAVAMAPAADVPDGQFHLDQSDEIADDRTNADIFETAISEEVYEQNYQYGTDTHVPDTWYRNARYLASVEENQERWTERFYQLLSGHGLPTGPFPFTPGGRIFANAGTSLGKATLINCLAGETLVLTDQGRTPIRELAGSTATLLTRNGKWVEAPVKSYGKQPLRKVTLSRNGQERVIYATPNHRWYVGTKATSGYEVVETDELQSHHRLEQVHSRRHTSVSPSPVGIARGFTFGDGSLVPTSPGAAANVNLVGEKDGALENYFAPFARSEYDYSAGVTRYRGLPDAWKTTPIELDENSATLYGWAAGYFAADGCVSAEGEVIMDSCTREHIEHFIDVIEVLGIDHYGLKTQERTSNLTGEPSTRYYVRLNPTSLREEFFVLDEHRIRFNEHGDRSLTYHWHVESVEETDRHETVYCAEVPEEKAFALGNGILTGNCFVSGFQGYDQDSMDEIQAELTRQAKILASEGGYGFCAHVMRPRGSRIGGVGSMTPGAVQMLDCWNEQAATIVAGSGLQSDRDDVKDKIRKGAQMVTMGVWHPDIIEFIKAKQEPGRLHKFNMSILISDAFMKAVKNDEKWALRFPAFEEEPEFYQEHWDGNLQAYEAKGGTVKTWRDPATGEKAVYDAREIWDLVMDSTYNRNEPGVIFVDTINRENNLQYCEHINATNPCVTGDTLISTAEGLRPAEELVGQPCDIVVDGRQSEEPVKKTTGVFQTGTKQVYRLRTKRGYELRLTADHKVMTERGWVEAAELTAGDEVHLQNRNGRFGTEGSLSEGRVLGWLVGDGHFKHGRGEVMLSFFGDDAQVADTFAEYVNEIVPSGTNGREYEITATEAEREGATVAEKRVTSQRLYEQTDEYGLGDDKLEVPESVMRGSKDMARGFLQALFSADGSVQGRPEDGASVRLTSVNSSLLKDVQRLLLNFGIASTLYSDRKSEGTKEMPDGQGGRKEYEVQAVHEIAIAKDNLLRFREEIGFLLDTKNHQLDALLSSYTEGPYAERFTATVEALEADGVEPVYDLTEPDTHSFVANGVVVHNCGEQVLPVGGVCLLGNFNLTQFVDREAKEIDYDLLDELIPSAVRFLDNVNDLSYVPLEEQRRNLQQKRRVGLGHFGDGSALMMMKTRYGSEEGVQVMREFQQHLANKAYQASARLAEEKGAFPLFDKDEYLSNPFVQRLSDETKEMIGDLGLRNSHLLSIQPTGNTSTLANAPSSGIEPVFMHSYIRTSEQPALPDTLTAPEMSPRAYSAGDTVDADGTTWAAEEHGDEVVLRCADEGYTQWQIHPTRGICKDEKVEDYAVRHMKDWGEWDAEADWAVTTRDLDVDDHLRQMEALAPFIDSSMSKTVNVPADYPFDEFKDLYRKAWETGSIKGVTTYRAGTMSAVLSGDDEDEDTLPRTEAPDRPEELPCAIHRVRYRGDHWTVLVGFLEDDPYEVFAFKADGEAPLFGDPAERIDEGVIRKNESRHYSLLSPEGEVVIDDITSHMPSDEARVETRLVSTALRHGSKVDFLVEQLEKAEGSIASFGRAMAKALSAHATSHEVTCDKCGSSNVRHVEGCMMCADCGHSRCS
ncbi:MAG: LAGLIDADG family homing endonuclease [Salinibacter sp.]